jgi:hypothetical protein
MYGGYDSGAIAIGLRAQVVLASPGGNVTAYIFDPVYDWVGPFVSPAFSASGGDIWEYDIDLNIMTLISTPPTGVWAEVTAAQRTINITYSSPSTDWVEVTTAQKNINVTYSSGSEGWTEVTAAQKNISVTYASGSNGWAEAGIGKTISIDYGKESGKNSWLMPAAVIGGAIVAGAALAKGKNK